MRRYNTFISIGLLLWTFGESSKLAYCYPQAQSAPEIYLYNETGAPVTFSASAQGCVRWEHKSTPSRFETTSGYAEGYDVTVPKNTTSGNFGGWDFVGVPQSTPGGTLAYSKYLIQAGNLKIYIDFRDTRYLPGNAFGYQSPDMHLVFTGNSWKCKRANASTYTNVANGGTIGIWTIFGVSGPAARDGFKVPVTIQTNFTGGKVRINGTQYNSPKDTSFTIGSSFSISVDNNQVDANGCGWTYSYWSDGGALSHSITISSLDNKITRTAYFIATSSPPSAPQNLQFSSSPPNWSLRLTWNAVTTPGVIGYTVYRKIDNGNWGVIATTSSNSYTDTDIYVNGKPNHKAYYKVDSYTACAHSQPSAEVYTFFDHIVFKSWSADEDTKMNAQVGEPASTSLLANYPNPFNPETTIHYYLAKDGQVSIAIYNHLGQQITQLLNEHQPSGEHIVIWNGKDRFGKTVASGVYFCKLQAEGFSQTVKMILAK